MKQCVRAFYCICPDASRFGQGFAVRTMNWFHFTFSSVALTMLFLVTRIKEVKLEVTEALLSTYSLKNLSNIRQQNHS